MRKPLSIRFVEKAEAAMVAAVEIYNKPSFSYREETFALLMLNAWELLLKGKILADNNNNPAAIRVYENRQTKSGKKSTKRYVKRNRSGNPITIGLQRCIVELDEDPNTRLPTTVKQNLEALTEIRDNAAHYVNASPVLAKQVLEVASASIRNCVYLCKTWFGCDLSNSLSILLPLAFLGGAAEAELVSVTSDERNLIRYLSDLGANSDLSDEPYHVALRFDINLKRSELNTASIVEVSSDPGAVKVSLSEDDIRKRYPWSYNDLVAHLKKRYTDFKQNRTFNSQMKELKDDPALARERQLDPGNPKSAVKVFYSGNSLNWFDKHYTKKK